MTRQVKNDLYLATRAKQGDAAAFRQLVDKHYTWVYSKVYRILKNYQDTEEVSLEVFTKVSEELRNNDKWDPKQGGSFQAFLSIVTRNTINEYEA